MFESVSETVSYGSCVLGSPCTHVLQHVRGISVCVDIRDKAEKRKRHHSHRKRTSSSDSSDSGSASSSSEESEDTTPSESSSSKWDVRQRCLIEMLD